MAQRERRITVRKAITARGNRRMWCALACLLLVTGLCAPAALADAQIDSADHVWTSVPFDANTRSPADGELRAGLTKYRAAQLDYNVIDALLDTAPLEGTPTAIQRQSVIALPMPDGGYARFNFVEAPIMEAPLAAKYPELRTYVGWGVDDPHATLRFDVTPAGLHAQILSPHGAVYIDPIDAADNVTHISYYRHDYRRPAGSFICETDGEISSDDDHAGPFARSAGELVTYRIAVAATAEYTAKFPPGDVAAGLAAIVTAINRVTGIYETELGIRLILVANNDLLVYTSNPDPYTNGSGTAMISENQANIDSVIGDGNYDVGHVFGTLGGSRATQSTVCVSGQKAQGVTTSLLPFGDPFYVDYVSHEIGHQFGASHTFNSETSACNGNRVGTTAFEPGSGSTIMAYAGICGTDNLQPNSDPFFHHESFRQITSYITFGSGSSCGSSAITGNADPVVNAGPDYFVPTFTPFVLTASATDGDGDPLTYSWEERDLGPAAAVSSPDNGASPLFRAWPPTVDPSRTFPRLGDLVNNTLAVGEQMPNSFRVLNFRATARDNRTVGGGAGYDDMQVHIDTSTGPFVVTSPNTGAEIWGTNGTVTWDVAGTSTGAINVSSVGIYLSTNGGLTYPYTLADSTPNDGSEALKFALPSTSAARVKVAAIGNIFFDISNADFVIDAPAFIIDLPDGAPTSLVPGLPTSFGVKITPLDETLIPGGALLHYRYDGGAFQTVVLSELGGDFYKATLPRAVCGDTPEFYVSAEGDGGGIVTHPLDAPTNAFQATIGETAVLFADDFETDTGWTVTASSVAVDGLWERGVPVNEGRGDPPADYDGSGQCYLTENTATYPASDVDSGTTTLTSPVIDLSGGGTISYAVWLNDYTGDPNYPMGANDGVDVAYATDAGGTNWQLIRSYTGGLAAWRPDSIEVGTETPTSATFRVRFVAKDIPPGDPVEAGLDAFNVTAFTCTEVGNGDFDSDGDVDLYDFAALQACWLEPSMTPTCEPGDLNGDDVLDATDIDVFTQILSGP
ncbi:MAG: hypothetical protein H6817_04480 [Phycisphaerales bacterium]|nr:hypothetical protein [Phycisphaerales bacterium]